MLLAPASSPSMIVHAAPGLCSSALRYHSTHKSTLPKYIVSYFRCPSELTDWDLLLLLIVLGVVTNQQTTQPRTHIPWSTYYLLYVTTILICARIWPISRCCWGPVVVVGPQTVVPAGVVVVERTSWNWPVK